MGAAGLKWSVLMRCRLSLCDALCAARFFLPGLGCRRLCGRPACRILLLVVQRFPSTNVTWIGERLAAGDAGAADIRQHVMARYASPLAAYVERSSLRELGDAHEVVNGFFAADLCREGFFERWHASGIKLRRWLMNGLHLHGRSLLRDHHRSRETGGAPDEHALRIETDAARAFERGWAERLLAEA